MIESPILQKWLREGEVQTRQTILLETLEERFGLIPADVSASVRVVQDEIRLKLLNRAANTCDSLDAFRLILLQQPNAN